MATVQPRNTTGAYGQERSWPDLAISRMVGETGCGMTAMIIAIIGLAQPEWAMLASIATIAVGAALVFEGAAAAARCSAASQGSHESYAVISTEFLGGTPGVILGVLAILGIAAPTLVSVSLIVFGASLIVGNVASNRFHSMHTARDLSGDDLQFAVLPDVMLAASGVESLFGLAAIVLGIVALLGRETPTMTLNLVGLLVVAAFVVLSSTEFARHIVHLRGH